MVHTTTSPFILPLDALVRSVTLNPIAGYAVFLGAGASVASGIPDAATCIWHWKRAIFASNQPGCREDDLDLALPQTRALIQAWLDAQGMYPPTGSPDEYCVYVEHCYPIEDDRRLYFQQLAKRAEPSVGYSWLCWLAQAGLIRSIWTTNFDGLTLRATIYNSLPISILLNQKYARLLRSDDGPLYVALHGDYRYSALKNTASELRELDHSLRELLVSHLKDQHLLVTGYSGRDESVMEALRAAYTQVGEGRLYWCGYLEDAPGDSVRRLMEWAWLHGRSAYYVPTQGFDALMTQLAQHILPPDVLESTNQMTEDE